MTSFLIYVDILAYFSFFFFFLFTIAPSSLSPSLLPSSFIII